MKNSYVKLVTLAIIAAGVVASADVLELKNGTVLSGKYIGGTADAINFETSAGTQVINAGQAVALTFTARTPTAQAETSPEKTPAATPAGKSVTVPAGTTLLVRVNDPVSSHSPPGTKFTTRLEYDLVSENVVAVKAGTTIYGQVASSTQARRAVGQSTLDLRLSQISLGGTTVPIITSGYQQAGERSVRKSARGAAAGAAIGAIGGDAGKGAAIGATAGALRKGETITVTPGALLEFTLSQPVTINAQ